MRGENWRFWLPVVLLLLFAGYSSQKLVRAHVNPDVDDIDYTFERDLPLNDGERAALTAIAAVR